MQDNISFIVVNYFTNELIYDLIHSINQNNNEVHFEIVVVDNTTDEKFRFKSQFDKMKIYYTGKNVGFGSACNIGAKLATHENLVFMNPDTLFIHNESIQNLYKFFQAFPWNTIFGGRILNRDNKPVYNTFKFSNFIHIYFQNTFRRVFGMSLPLLTNIDSACKKNHVTEVDWISGAFMCINKEFFLKLGGFNQDLFMYEEDAELCYRAKLSNGKVVFTPTIKIVHYGSAASKKNTELLSFIGLRSSLYFYEKRNSHLKALLLKKLILITWKLLYFQFLILARIISPIFSTRVSFLKKLVMIMKKYDKTSTQEIIKNL